MSSFEPIRGRGVRPNPSLKPQEKPELLEMQHDIFSCNTRNQFQQAFEALRELKALPEAALSKDKSSKL